MDIWEKFLTEVLQEEDLPRLKSSLLNKKPVYFYGPQGVGKSVLAGALNVLGYAAFEPGQSQFCEKEGGPMHIPMEGNYEIFELSSSRDSKAIPNLFENLISHPGQLDKWLKSA